MNLGITRSAPDSDSARALRPASHGQETVSPKLVANSLGPLLPQVQALPVAPPPVFISAPIGAQLAAPWMKSLPPSYSNTWLSPALLNSNLISSQTRLTAPSQQTLATFANSPQVTQLPPLQRTIVLNRALYATLLYQTNPKQISTQEFQQTLNSLTSTNDEPNAPNDSNQGIAPDAANSLVQTRLNELLTAIRAGKYAGDSSAHDLALAYVDKLKLGGVERVSIRAEIGGQRLIRMQLLKLAEDEALWQRWVDTNLANRTAPDNQTALDSINSMLNIKRELIQLTGLRWMLSNDMLETALPTYQGEQLTSASLQKRIGKLTDTMGLIDSQTQRITMKIQAEVKPRIRIGSENIPLTPGDRPVGPTNNGWHAFNTAAGQELATAHPGLFHGLNKVIDVVLDPYNMVDLNQAQLVVPPALSAGQGLRLRVENVIGAGAQSTVLQVSVTNEQSGVKNDFVLKVEHLNVTRGPGEIQVRNLGVRGKQDRMIPFPDVMKLQNFLRADPEVAAYMNTHNIDFADWMLAYDGTSTEPPSNQAAFAIADYTPGLSIVSPQQQQIFKAFADLANQKLAANPAFVGVQIDTIGRDNVLQAPGSPPRLIIVDPFLRD